MLELVDSHCHLEYDYDAGRTAVDLVRDAHAAGVSRIITVATDLDSLPKVAATSEKFEGVFHTVGIHPHEASTLRQEHLALLRAGAKHPKCRAIGEIGLDYYYKHSDRASQLQAMEWQLTLALEAELPVVVHTRDAETDQLPALERYARKITDGRIPGVLHCFTGTRPFAEACVALGFYISFSGILTFKTAEELRATAAALPLDRILVETDSPFLAPIPHRGKKCEPSMVRLTAQKLAEIRGVSLEEVARATTANAFRVFRL